MGIVHKCVGLPLSDRCLLTKLAAAILPSSERVSHSESPKQACFRAWFTSAFAQPLLASSSSRYVNSSTV